MLLYNLSVLNWKQFELATHRVPWKNKITVYYHHKQTKPQPGNPRTACHVDGSLFHVTGARDIFVTHRVIKRLFERDRALTAGLLTAPIAADTSQASPARLCLSE